MTSSHAPAHRSRSTTAPAILARVLVLGAPLAVTVFIAPVLIAQQSWMWLAVLLVAAIAMCALYSTKRFVPGKYLFPGTFFLAVFLILPIALTVGYSFTNYGTARAARRSRRSPRSWRTRCSSPRTHRATR